MTDLYNGTLRIEKSVYPVCGVCGFTQILFFDNDMSVKGIVAKLRYEGWTVSKHGLLCYQCKRDGKREVSQ